MMVREKMLAFINLRIGETANIDIEFLAHGEQKLFDALGSGISEKLFHLSDILPAIFFNENGAFGY